ncbi:winged helix-turn-helix transcriptional regulator [Rhabdobacter roseus]|uniref:DNA-binding HxlR family transcriptional regulator n=1 Tax=Rhabdobacter roseus TaxID=1655419 RepID=A0A840TIW9_9BACT|nr:helix-turn-helix domain-containing protein [Rhabdobacter roseus]MBB5283394.1 DNA-binding HxlR family transcriptional regulator [Rhabdobacter roseus]
MKDFRHEHRLYYSPVEFAMAHLGGTWKIPILLSLRHGPVRYGDLKERIPHISHKMLNTQLRELEKKGMITRTLYREKPPRVEYALTAKAQRALPILDQLTAYGEYLMAAAGVGG